MVNWIVVVLGILLLGSAIYLPTARQNFLSDISLERTAFHEFIINNPLGLGYVYFMGVIGIILIVVGFNLGVRS